jgi:hypothetical protein
MPRARRGQGTCGDPNKYHKVSRLRRVCVAINGRQRTCKSGTRLASGKCKRAPLSAEQKKYVRTLSRMKRQAKKEDKKKAAAGALISKIGKGFATRIQTRGLKYL